MTLVRLACPNCGTDLTGPPGAVLFPCAGCGQTCEAAAGRLRRVATRALAPRREARDRRLVHLPCWCFTLTCVADAPVAGLPPRVVVPSVGPMPGGIFLRLARGLSMAAKGWAAPAVGASAAAPAGALPGRLGVADALALAQTVALACVPGTVRAGLLTAEPFPLRLADAELVWLPCAFNGARCEDLLVGLDVHARLLEGGQQAPTARPARPPEGVPADDPVGAPR